MKGRPLKTSGLTRKLRFFNLKILEPQEFDIFRNIY